LILGKELYMVAQLDDKYIGAALDSKITIDGITIGAARIVARVL